MKRGWFGKYLLQRKCVSGKYEWLNLSKVGKYFNNFKNNK